MSQKMTLEQYIVSRNYTRRLISKSKSKKKLSQLQPSLLLTNSVNPSVITGSSDQNDKHKLLSTVIISDIASQIKEIDEEAEGFSLIHKKVEEIKEFVREYIRDDKIFVAFCRRIDELESIFRLELIEAYRFQLFKYQFDHKNKLDDEKKKMIRILNDHYMNSKFEYKKSINKGKIQLTKSQTLVLQKLIHEKAQQGGKLQENTDKQKQKQLAVSELVETKQTINDPGLIKQPISLLQSISMMIGSKDKQSPQTKNSDMVESKFISKTQYKSQSIDKLCLTTQKVPSKKKTYESDSLNTHSNPFKSKKPNLDHGVRQSKISCQPQGHTIRDSVQIKVNPNLIRSPSAKKVAFLPYDSKQQNPNEYPIPNFQPKPQSLKKNPDQMVKDTDQSDVNMASNNPSSSSESQIVGSFLSLLNKNSSKEQKITTQEKSQKPEEQEKTHKPEKQQQQQKTQQQDNLEKSPPNNTKQYKIEPVKNSKSPGSRTPRKKTARQIIDERQKRQLRKLVRSKDYLRVKK